jgi:LiaI-LiaF-like transmembrane region
MRIFPLALIAIGVFGLLKHYGLVDAAFLQLFWPLLLIGIGAAMLLRGPRWRAETRERMQDRWERRMHRHFGPGWANLSEEERERFRAGMRQWHSHSHGGEGVRRSAPTSEGDGSSRKSSPAPGEQG